MRLPQRAIVIVTAAVLTVLVCIAGAVRLAGGSTHDPIAVSLLSAAPTLVASDHPGAGFAARLTFSPNGDGRNDVVHLRVHSAAGHGHLVLMEVFQWRPQRGFMLRQVTHAHTDGAGNAPFAWDGRFADGATAADASYLVTACDGSVGPHASRLLNRQMHAGNRSDGDGDATDPTAPIVLSVDGHGCLPQPVVVHVRRLSGYVVGTGSYAPGSPVPIRIQSDEPAATVKLYIDGLESRGSLATAQYAVAGPVTDEFWLPPSVPSGLYRLAITDSAGDTRWLPLVVRSGTVALDAPPTHSVLVVWPYLDWRAYNQIDLDRNGRPDTWYQAWRQRQVSLVGPYEEGSNDPVAQGKENDWDKTRNFMRWMFVRQDHSPYTSITDVELGQMTPEQLHAYSGIVFPGHTEYYTQGVYDAIKGYSHTGGHVAFLSANSIFRRVSIDQGHDLVHLVDPIARHPGQSDFALVGVGFDTCCFARNLWPAYTVTAQATAVAPWLFDGTGLVTGSSFGHAGIEIDRMDAVMSPPTTLPLAVATTDTIPVHHAVMALTPFVGGGDVLATGNMAFLSNLRTDLTTHTVARRLMDNVWRHLAGDDPSDEPTNVTGTTLPTSAVAAATSLDPPVAPFSSR